GCLSGHYTTLMIQCSGVGRRSAEFRFARCVPAHQLSDTALAAKDGGDSNSHGDDLLRSADPRPPSRPGQALLARRRSGSRIQSFSPLPDVWKLDRQAAVDRVDHRISLQGEAPGVGGPDLLHLLDKQV